MNKTIQWLAKSFLKGLLLVVPLGVTAWVVFSVFKWIDRLLVFPVPGLGFLITISLIVLAGALGSNLLVGRFMAYMERGLTRLPLVKLLYFSLKDLINAFVGEKKSFRTPVLVSLLPQAEAKVLGFVTAESLELPGTQDHVAVYVPQSYNFAGNLILVARSRVTPLPPEESAQWLSFIVSGGVSGGALNGPSRGPNPAFREPG